MQIEDATSVPSCDNSSNRGGETPIELHPVVGKGSGEHHSKKRQNQIYNWCYTVNNYTTKDIIPAVDVNYRIQGYETAPETGTPHIQGYAQFVQRIRLATLVSKYPGVHWEQAKGTPWQNFVYCSKSGTFDELGPRPKEPKPKDTTYEEAIGASTVSEGIAIVKEKRPRDYCLHGESIERNLKKVRSKVSHSLCAD